MESQRGLLCESTIPIFQRSQVWCSNIIRIWRELDATSTAAVKCCLSWVLFKSSHSPSSLFLKSLSDSDSHVAKFITCAKCFFEFFSSLAADDYPHGYLCLNGCSLLSPKETDSLDTGRWNLRPIERMLTQLLQFSRTDTLETFSHWNLSNGECFSGGLRHKQLKSRVLSDVVEFKQRLSQEKQIGSNYVAHADDLC